MHMKWDENNCWKSRRSSSHSPTTKGDDHPVLRSKYTVAKKQPSKNSISEATSSRMIFSSKYGRGESRSKQKDLQKAESFRHKLMLDESDDTPSKYNLLKDALKKSEGRTLLDFDKWRENSTEQFRHVSVSNLNALGKSTVYKEDKFEVKKQVTKGYRPFASKKSSGFSRSCGNVLSIARNEFYQESYSDSQSDSIQDCSNFPSKISIACEESFDVLKKRSRSLTDLKSEIIEDDGYTDEKSKVSVALSNINREINETQPIQFKYKSLQKKYNKKSEPYSKYLSKKQVKVSDAEYKAWLKKHKLIVNSDSDSKSSEEKSPPKEEEYEPLSSRSGRHYKQIPVQIELYTLEVDAFFNALNFFYMFAKTHEWFKQMVYTIPILVALIIAFCSE